MSGQCRTVVCGDTGRKYYLSIKLICNRTPFQGELIPQAEAFDLTSTKYVTNQPIQRMRKQMHWRAVAIWLNPFFQMIHINNNFLYLIMFSVLVPM